MRANRDLTIFLVIIFLALLSGYTSYSTPSVPSSTFSRPLNSGSAPEPHISDYEDYNDLDGKTTVKPPTAISMAVLCDYNFCRDLQVPCALLEKATGCLCPGLTSYREPPHPPNITKMFGEGSDVVIQWCSPQSPVTTYTVTVGGEVRQRLGADRRTATVGNVDHGAEVCVFAVNDVGENKTCGIYQFTGDNVPLTAGLIGGALGFLLLLLLAALLWRDRTRRKSEVIST